MLKRKRCLASSLVSKQNTDAEVAGPVGTDQDLNAEGFLLLAAPLGTVLPCLQKALLGIQDQGCHVPPPLN